MSTDRMARCSNASRLAAAFRMLMAALALAPLVIGIAGGAAKAQPATWQMVPAESRIVFVATQLGAPFEGVFETFGAEIAFDKDDLAASKAEVTIEVGSLNTGEDQRDGQARGPDFFDVDTHPQAVFRTDAMRAEGAGYVADGTLTMKGVSKPVVLPFTLTFEGEDTARMAGSLTIDRTEWGVGTGEWTSGDTVGKEVEIRIELLARK